MNIKVKNLTFSYGTRKVLEDVSFEATSGEVLSILGPNGVGKSTLFRCILGLLHGYSGEILIDGTTARSLSIRETAKRIAYIPQSSHPAFHYSVFDIVLMGTTSGLSTFAAPRTQDLTHATWALEKVGIPHLRDRCFHHLSGGERQLTLIARALAQRSPILMLDEPTASLDFGNQMLVLTQAQALAREGYTVIQTTHNPEQTYMFSDRVLALSGGRVLCDGPPQTVLNKGLISTLYGVDVEISSLFDDRVRVCTPEIILR